MPKGQYARKKWSEERKLERSKKFSGKGNPFYGKSHSSDVKDRISNKLKKQPVKYWLGKTRSDETKRNCSLSQKDS